MRVQASTPSATTRKRRTCFNSNSRSINGAAERSGRRFFAARADVGDAFIQMAVRRGLTLYSLLSDTLGKVVELDASGISLDDAVRGFNAQKMARDIGFASVPENLWYETAETSLRVERRGTLTRFGDCGEWIGRYVLAKSQGNNLTGELVKCLTPLSFDASEFSIEGNDTLRLRFVDPHQPPAYTEAFSTLLTRAVEAVGYECETRSHSRGMILLQFCRAKGLDRKLRREIFA